METPNSKGRAHRVRKNLKQGMALAWAASPSSLIRFSLLGILNSTMTPIAVYLGAMLVNRIAEARIHTLQFKDVLSIVIGLWIVAAVQRAVGAYMGYGRHLFVRRGEMGDRRPLVGPPLNGRTGPFDHSD